MAREGSEELVWARNELKATLATLEADLEALEESVEVVESTGPRLFNLGDAEVAERRKYVIRVRKEIEVMRTEAEHSLHSTTGDSPYGQKSTPSSSRLSLPSNTRLPPGEDIHQESQWERQAQQLLIQEQDRTMDSISGTLTTLAQQAGLMGREIDQHVEMLGDLEENVDRTDMNLSAAMKKLRKFVRETEETKSGWCIMILIIVLVVLLILVVWI